MPSISIDQPTTAGNPHASPLAANGGYSLDNPSHTFTITGTATYTVGVFQKAVDGTGVAAGNDRWSMTFAIPDAGVTVDIEVTIDEVGSGSNSATRSGIVMQ